MFKQIASIGKAFENYMIVRGRSEARRILLSQGDQTLEDIGIDRHELVGGVKNWPWDGSVTKQANQLREQSRAITELDRYSDRELHDIGINRGMIADAVVNGRANIEQRASAKPATGGDRQAA